MNTIKQSKDRVFDAITSERDYQNRKWGTTIEHPHEVGAWLALIQHHTVKALAAWAGSDGDRAALQELRKILALGVACAEQHGIENRHSGPVSERMRK